MRRSKFKTASSLLLAASLQFACGMTVVPSAEPTSSDPVARQRSELKAGTASLGYTCSDGICQCEDFLDCLAMAPECVPTTYECPWQLTVCYCIDEVVTRPGKGEATPAEPPPGELQP